MYGWDCVCQVHQACQQSRDHPLQQERAHIHEERLILPALQNRRFKARLREGSIQMSSVTWWTSPFSGTVGSVKLIASRGTNWMVHYGEGAAGVWGENGPLMAVWVGGWTSPLRIWWWLNESFPYSLSINLFYSTMTFTIHFANG